MIADLLCWGDSGQIYYYQPQSPCLYNVLNLISSIYTTSLLWIYSYVINSQTEHFTSNHHNKYFTYSKNLQVYPNLKVWNLFILRSGVWCIVSASSNVYRGFSLSLLTLVHRRWSGRVPRLFFHLRLDEKLYTFSLILFWYLKETLYLIIF